MRKRSLRVPETPNDTRTPKNGLEWPFFDINLVSKFLKKNWKKLVIFCWQVYGTMRKRSLRVPQTPNDTETPKNGLEWPFFEKKNFFHKIDEKRLNCGCCWFSIDWERGYLAWNFIALRNHVFNLCKLTWGTSSITPVPKLGGKCT